MPLFKEMADTDNNQVVTPSEGRGKRDRKAVVPLVAEVASVKEAWAPSGSGTELGSMEYCKQMRLEFMYLLVM